jgi:hypothetical protein
MKTAKTSKEYEELGCGLVLTDCKVHLNSNPTPIPGRDRRVATVNVTINNCLIINNIKVTENAQKTWSIELPSMLIKNDTNPLGKKFYNVMLANEQYEVLRSYCYDRISEALSGSGFSKPAPEGAN